MRLFRLALCALNVLVLTVVLGVTPAQAAYSTSPQGLWVPNGTVYSIARHGDRVYLGGGFTSLRNVVTGVTVPRTRLAALDATSGELVTSFKPSADAVVRALAVSADGGTVYAGGDFIQVNGVSQTRLAAMDTGGALIPGWQATANASVRDIIVSGGGLYVGGKFGNVNGTGRRGLARLEAATGALTTSWVAHVGLGRVLALALSADGSRLLAGGSFQTLDGMPRPFVGSVTLDEGVVTGWAPPAVCGTCTVFDLAVDGMSVYGATGGGAGGRGVSWDATTGARHWVVRGDGDVQAVAVHGDEVYLGGHFGPVFDDTTRNQLAAVDRFNGDLLAFSIPFTGLAKPGLWALVADGERLRIGGGFQGIENTRYRKYAELALQ